jgi:hypothetical protein
MMIYEAAANSLEMLASQKVTVDMGKLFEDVYTAMGKRNVKAVVRRQDEQAAQGNSQNRPEELLGNGQQVQGVGGIDPNFLAAQAGRFA